MSLKSDNGLGVQVAVTRGVGLAVGDIVAVLVIVKVAEIVGVGDNVGELVLVAEMVGVAV
jgi:hypothetical protein